jgi:hypothetical protein
VAPEDAAAFEERWIGPYQRWCPDWAYAARAGGAVAGYLTGCPDSVRMAALRFAFGPAPRVGPNVDFGAGLMWRLTRDYPAHLHVNVRESFRGGVGRSLVERYERDLADAGIAGVHLFCGRRAAGFYEKVGYRELARRKRGEAEVFAFGKSLPKLRS